MKDFRLVDYYFTPLCPAEGLTFLADGILLSGERTELGEARTTAPICKRQGEGHGHSVRLP